MNVFIVDYYMNHKMVAEYSLHNGTMTLVKNFPQACFSVFDTGKASLNFPDAC